LNHADEKLSDWKGRGGLLGVMKAAAVAFDEVGRTVVVTYHTPAAEAGIQRHARWVIPKSSGHLALHLLNSLFARFSI
jgi:hypothetical protein